MDALRLRVSHRLEQIYPDMHQAALADLVPLALGNIRHIAEVRQTVRTLDIEHHEWVLCVGRGFDFQSFCPLFRGMATVAAMVSGLAPERLSVTWMVGKSTFGKSLTGSLR